MEELQHFGYLLLLIFYILLENDCGQSFSKIKRRLFMVYMGGKFRIRKHLLPILQKEADKAEGYLEPFFGGCRERWFLRL